MTTCLRVVVVTWLAAAAACAHAITCTPFPSPPRPSPPGLSVQSALAQDRIRIAIADSYTGSTATLAAAPETVDMRRNAGDIAITARLLDPCVAENPIGPFAVDLGLLPVGDYVVSYTSTNKFAQVHQGHLKFRIAASGAVTMWPTAPVVEFFSAGLNRYFMTADAGEIAALDDGSIRGWTRTGENFTAYPPDGIRANPVCRLYGSPQAGLDSHFFSADPAECAAVVARWRAWTLEHQGAFGAVATPVFKQGASLCDEGGTALFRLYSNRSGADHRYTVSTPTRNAMLAKGWIAEGAFLGPDGVPFAMCVLP